MQFISTYVHGMLDYAMGLLLLISSWLFSFVIKVPDPRDVPGTNPQSVIPILIGISAIVFAIFTNYKFGAVRKIPLSPGH